jgi:transposase
VYVSEVLVERFRSCERVQIPLRPEVTVLVGENNAGKSSVIDALRLLTDSLDGRRVRYFEESDVLRTTADLGGPSLQMDLGSVWRIGGRWAGVGYRGGLTDEQWAVIEPLLPDRTPRRGGRWTDHRLVIDAVAWRFRGNSAWRDLPEWFGPWQTLYHRFAAWAKDGTWHRLLVELQIKADAAGDIDWLVGVDSTIVRAHQHAAGARKKGVPAGEPHTHALGRSRGGLSTKVHLAADGRCRPLALIVTAGQAGDAPAFGDVMAAVRVPRTGAGRPRTRPDAVLADRAYPSRAIRHHLHRRGIRAVIPEPADQQNNRKRRGRAGGRPRSLDRKAYKQRNVVERCINRLKQWRGLAMRTDKLALHYLAGLHLAAIFMWSRQWSARHSLPRVAPFSSSVS